MQLTKPEEDRLVALNGVAQEFIAQESSAKLVCGLRPWCLGMDLLWKQNAAGIHSRYTEFPSWSWASVNTAVSWILTDNATKCFNVVSVSSTPGGRSGLPARAGGNNTSPTGSPSGTANQAISTAIFAPEASMNTLNIRCRLLPVGFGPILKETSRDLVYRASRYPKEEPPIDCPPQAVALATDKDTIAGWGSLEEPNLQLDDAFARNPIIFAFCVSVLTVPRGSGLFSKIWGDESIFNVVFLSKLKKKLRSSGSANKQSSRPASVPSAASTSQTTTPSSHQSTGSFLTALVEGSPVIVLPSTETTEPATASSPSPEPQNAIPSIPERLWNKAYDILEEKEAEIVKSYQEILKLAQLEWDDIAAPEELQHLEHCKTDKSRQMWRLVYSGLEKSKRQAKLKESVSNIIETIDNLKGVVDKAVKYSSEAAIAWAGVTLGLEILSNPMKEPGLNRKGIAYVLSRMEWYWNLAELVLLDNSSVPSAALRTNLETQIIEFYKKLLLFQMRSACLYYRNWAGIILRDAVKLDDWSGELNTIKDAERLIREDIEQYDNQDIRLKLGTIETSSAEQAESLESICKILREEARLKEKNAQDDKDNDCLRALLVTDPRTDKKGIQSQKGDPLKESYEWILKSDAYSKFIDDPSSRVLWINGPPGKGKTMLLCGIIDELQNSLRPISFFFCQANVKEKDLSSDVAVMRGLIYVLLEHQPSLISVIRPSYDKQKDRLFNSINSSEFLRNILTMMLQDPCLHDTILLVDALDECTVNRSNITNLIVELSEFCNTKWIVSSREWPEIHQELVDATGLISLNLEHEHEAVSRAVKSYISKRVDYLSKTKWKNDLVLKEKVFDYMQSHADDTFLWVALVCERLANSGIRKRLVMEELVKFPTSLTALYQAMMHRINDSPDADRLKQILALVCVAYRPLTSAEIPTLVKSMDDYDEEDVKDSIASCGSFLTLQDGKILFVHQSAKEFLLDQGHKSIFPYGESHQHAQIFSRSVEAMENVLRQDIYELDSLGTDDWDERSDHGPLSSVKYSCVYWTRHLCKSDLTSETSSSKLRKALHFLQMKFTCWLEALGLMYELSTAVTSMMELETAVEDVKMLELNAFVGDARRFIAHHKPSIEDAPLQVYCSALIFSPKSSLIRRQFSYQIPEWVFVKPEMSDDWDAQMQTIYLYDTPFDAVLSPDGRYLACSALSTCHLFETVSGDLLGEMTVVFPNDQSIRILDATKFRVIHTLEVKADQCLFLPEGSTIAVVFEEAVTVLDWKTGALVSSLGRINKKESKVAMLSANYIAAVSTGATEVKIWDLGTGDCKHTFDWDVKEIDLVACSPDGHRIAAVSSYSIRLWYLDNTQSWVHKHDLGLEHVSRCLVFSADSRMLISGSFEKFIHIWDDTGSCIKVLKGHSQYITCLSTCQTGTKLASGSDDGTVKLWDLSDILSDQFQEKRPSSVLAGGNSSDASEQYSHSNEDHRIDSLLFSPTGKMLASISEEETHIWDARTDACTNLIVSGGSSGPDEVSFTPDDRLVAMRDMDGKLGVWDTELQAQVYFSDLNDPTLIAIAKNGQCVRSLSDFDTDGENLLRNWHLIENPQTQKHIPGEIFPLKGVAPPDRFVYSDNWNFLAVATGFSDLQVLHRKSGHWVDEPLPGVNRAFFGDTPLAFSPDNEWLLTCNQRPGSFVISELSCPYRVKDLGSLEADAPPYNTPKLKKPHWRIPTRLGLLGVGKPSGFEGTRRIAWGLSIDMDWIMWGNERILWIPADYRRMALDINGWRAAFVCPSGRIEIMKFR
ncbi:heterokaryon incompatibility protein het-E-1 [Fusarium circinatum]|uniref:Heterokaryon incompatibility protein het-E-1 n=1 Tax=Fusarium circinatum TaxID=48490 RepID=A0A8H5X3L3_FUSCI|nr:heterokaryon incompatibility protein het-E-1 [Fusarium circinatum]